MRPASFQGLVTTYRFSNENDNGGNYEHLCFFAVNPSVDSIDDAE